MVFKTKSFLFIIIALLSSSAYARPVTIAVIDSGFGFEDRGHEANLCKYGHKDFTNEKKFSSKYRTVDPVPVDTHSHGTNIVGIIDNYLKKTNTEYCIVIVKYYTIGQTNQEDMLASINALRYAADIQADYVNYSGGGPGESYLEKDPIEKFLNQGGQFIAAAGNERQNLDLPENAYYPAMYDSRITVVGNLGKDGIRHRSSNYGKSVTIWEIGEDVEAYGIIMTGTSQATAIATAKIVAKRSKQGYYGENNGNK